MKIKLIEGQSLPRCVCIMAIDDYFTSDQYRQIKIGEAVEVSDAVGQFLIDGGFCEKFAENNIERSIEDGD